MKKTNITVAYDERKLAALRIYLQENDTDLDSQMIAQLDRLFSRYVPAKVQDYLAKLQPGEEK